MCAECRQKQRVEKAATVDKEVRKHQYNQDRKNEQLLEESVRETKKFQNEEDYVSFVQSMLNKLIENGFTLTPLQQQELTYDAAVEIAESLQLDPASVASIRICARASRDFVSNAHPLHSKLVALLSQPLLDDADLLVLEKWSDEILKF
jgi:replicative DNA helicase